MSSSTSSQPRQDSTTASASDAGLKIWSCVICRRRKIRCDRRDPCANCVKSNIDCHYPVTGRIPRRSRDPAAWKSPAQKQTELLSRLRRLESVVTELAAQVEDGPTNSWPTPSTSGPGSSANVDELLATPVVTAQSESDSSRIPTAALQAGSEFDEEFGRLVIDKGGGLHVGNRFWSVFCSEVDNILQAVHDVADYDTESSRPATLENDLNSDFTSHSLQGFVFGNQDAIRSLDGLSPLPPQMLFIWQTYVENVDPFIKVLHIPSMGKIIQGLRGKLSSLGPNTEALLFAISLAAIASMDAEDVVANFDVPKVQLLARYRFGTEQALAQAKFLTAKEVVLVQAFVIYLSVLPHIGMNQLSWPLTGLLIRIAKSLDLHKDLDRARCKQLDVEMRRRLWWQICFIDSRAYKSTSPELSISQVSFDTRQPSDIDDTALDSSQPRIPGPKPSNMTLTLIRCELWQLVQDLRAEPVKTHQSRLNIFLSARSKVENNYLRCLCPDSALDSFIKAMSSLFFAKVELVICRRRFLHPTKPTSSTVVPSRQHAITSALLPALTIIESVHALQTNPRWCKWRWQLQGQVPWHAMGLFLHQSCYQAWSSTFERVWILTNELIAMMPDDAKAESLWKPLNDLVANTQRHRERELTRSTQLTAENSTVFAMGNSSLNIPYTNNSVTENPDYFQYPANLPGALDVQSKVSASSLLPAVTSSSASDRVYNAQLDQWNLAAYSDSINRASPPFTEGRLISERQGFTAGSAEVDPMNWQAWEELEGMDLSWDLVDFG